MHVLCMLPVAWSLNLKIVDIDFLLSKCLSPFTACVTDCGFYNVSGFFFPVVVRAGDQTWGLTEVRARATELCP